MSDTQDHDKTTFVRSPGATSGTSDGQAGSDSPDQPSRMEPAAMAQKPAERIPSLDSVDFDVTAGFGDEPAPASDEFFDITQGAERPVPGEDSDLPMVDAAEPAPAAVATPAPVVAPTPPSPAPEAVPAPSGRSGSLVLIAIGVLAVVAVALWLAMR